MPDSNLDEITRPTCFVLMPISDTSGYETGHFGRVYEHLLKPAIINAGYFPIRADDSVKTEYIVVGIIKRIVEAEMVLCDFSSRNPNVLYELGIRHAFNKPVVLIKDTRTEKIFDIQGLRYTVYDDTLRIDAVNKDSQKITEAIRETGKNLSENHNSVVHLAGLKVAKVPEGQTISPDTELVLSAIGEITSRLQSVEKKVGAEGRPFFVLGKKLFVDDSEVELGESLFIGGALFGTLAGVNPFNQTILINKADGGGLMEMSADNFLVQGLSTIPF